MSMLSSVLEENVSEALILALKRAVLSLSIRVAVALHGALPSISLADCAWGSNLVATLVAGMWPGAFPGPVAAKVLAMPEFAGLRPDADRDLERAILVVFKGIKSK